MRPLIGIPLCLDASGRFRRGRRYHYIDQRYADAVAEAGGDPIYLPIQQRGQDLVQRIDGLLIPGGADLLPDAPYPEDVRFEATAPEQLDFDRALLADALERQIPFLGICYGMQILALQHGGTLLYHVPHDLPEAGEHRLPEEKGRHLIRVEPGTLLEAVLGRDEEPVNSAHHQAVATPGAGLRVSARAEDGVIEAVEGARERFCLGVQWHPERLADAHRRSLFAAFVSAAGGRSEAPASSPR
jgi:putative glutamine amidotransferase